VGFYKTDEGEVKPMPKRAVAKQPDGMAGKTDVGKKEI
jgi:hypothetical protein